MGSFVNPGKPVLNSLFFIFAEFCGFETDFCSFSVGSTCRNLYADLLSVVSISGTDGGALLLTASFVGWASGKTSIESWFLVRKLTRTREGMVSPNAMMKKKTVKLFRIDACR